MRCRHEFHNLVGHTSHPFLIALSSNCTSRSAQCSCCEKHIQGHGRCSSQKGLCSPKVCRCHTIYHIITNCTLKGYMFIVTPDTGWPLDMGAGLRCVIWKLASYVILLEFVSRSAMALQLFCNLSDMTVSMFGMQARYLHKELHEHTAVTEGHRERADALQQVLLPAPPPSSILSFSSAATSSGLCTSANRNMCPTSSRNASTP